VNLRHAAFPLFNVRLPIQEGEAPRPRQGKVAVSEIECPQDQRNECRDQDNQYNGSDGGIKPEGPVPA